METTQNTVTSKDGTTIAFEQAGSGPGIVLVPAALSDRADTAKLAKWLARNFTVLNYDRRGRGQSTDTPPYHIAREVEDIHALLEVAGGSAYLFGSSSGAVLALEAANHLGQSVRGLFLYEPPFIVDDSHPPMPDDLAPAIEKLLEEGRRSDAVKLFFRRGMGIPAVFVSLMRWLMPGWSKMTRMAHTTLYDLEILRGTQAGRPLPPDRWSAVRAPTRVMVGGKSGPFFHSGAQALARLLSDADYRSLPGRDHSAVMMAAKDLAAAIEDFVHNQRSLSRASHA